MGTLSCTVIQGMKIQVILIDRDCRRNGIETRATSSRPQAACPRGPGTPDLLQQGALGRDRVGPAGGFIYFKETPISVVLWENLGPDFPVAPFGLYCGAGTRSGVNHDETPLQGRAA